MERPVIWAGPSTQRSWALLSQAPPMPGRSTVLVAYPGFSTLVDGVSSYCWSGGTLFEVNPDGAELSGVTWRLDVEICEDAEHGGTVPTPRGSTPVLECLGTAWGYAQQRTGRKYMRAVWPIWLSTCCASVTPGMETEIWFFPVVCTSAPDTPSPSTRRFKMLTVSFRSAWVTCCPWAV